MARLSLSIVRWIALGLLTLYVALKLGLGPEDSGRTLATWIYEILLLGAAATCLARAAQLRGSARVAWALLGAAPVCWVAGDLVWDLVLESRDDVGYPSLADWLWLGSYALGIAGIAGLVRHRLLPGAGAQTWLDAAIGACATGGVVTAAWLGPTLAEPQSDLLQRIFDLAFPFGDIVLLALAVTIVTLTGARLQGAWIAVALALAVQGLADAWATRSIAVDISPPPEILSAVWPAAWLLIAFAASHPLPVREPGVTPTGRSIALPIAFAATALGVLVTAGFTPVEEVAVVLAGLAIALVVVRLASTLVTNARLTRRLHEETITDSLTGLRNRRALMVDLERTAAKRERVVFALFDLDGFKSYNDRFGHPAGDALLARLAGKLANASDQAAVYRLGGDEFCLLVPAPHADGVVGTAGAALSERGEGFEITSSAGSVNLPDETADPTDALILADRRMYATKARRPTSPQQQSRDVLLQALAQREPDLLEHSEGVSVLARRVAERLGLTAEACDDVARAADLHDVGKMAIPDAILSKPGPLDADEWAFMKRHTLIGEEIVAAAPALERVAAIVRSHHERWDGDGYPDGLAGEQIPLGSRIVAVCDAFNAMMQDRPYQQGRTREDALEEVRRSAGEHFDPDVVDAFVLELVHLEAVPS